MRKEAQSHEVDHVGTFEAARVALEIEWNNKDPFFDRDLENFKRLHADGAISLGIIVTRGAKLARFDVGSRRASPTTSSTRTPTWSALASTRRGGRSRDVTKRVTRAKNPIPFRDAWVDQFVATSSGGDDALEQAADRVQRGVGNPCPLVLIGLPSSIVTFGESSEVVEKLLEQGDPTPDQT